MNLLAILGIGISLKESLNLDKGAWVYVYPRYGGNKKMQTDTICSKRDRGCVSNLANFYTKDGKNI